MQIAPVAPSTQNAVAADQFPSFRDIFPGTRKGAFYLSTPGESYYLLPDGFSKIPFSCQSWVTEDRVDGSKWTDRFETTQIGNATLDVDVRRIPNTDKIRIAMSGEWNGAPYSIEQDYAVTQAKAGYLEFVNADGSTKDPYFFRSTPKAGTPGAYDVDFQIDAPGLGRMFKKGVVWLPHPANK